MARQSVPIPGEILKQTLIGGLTFDEIIVLAAIPLVLVLPAAFIDAVPLSVTLGIVAVGAIAVTIVVIKTPEGQSPTGWFPALLDRKIKPSNFQLKPKDHDKYGSQTVVYKNIVFTADKIAEESEQDVDVEELIKTIDHAEKLLLEDEDLLNDVDPSVITNNEVAP